MIIAIGVIAAVLVVAFAVWWFFPAEHPRHDCTEKHYLADRQDPFRRWVHGAIALYRGDVGDPGYWDASCAKANTSSWGCESAADLHALIADYTTGEINVAFDKARIIWLARVAVPRGWMNEQQSWELCRKAHVSLVHSYTSWDAFGSALARGRADWYGGTMPEEQQRSMAQSQAFAQASVLPLVAFA